MGRSLLWWGIVGIALATSAAEASPPAPEYKLYTDHPRLLLPPQRLRLLKRERERKSPRWRQFEMLVAGKARMPEPGFAEALYYQVAGDPEAARRAVQWAQGPSADLRQTALVFDWCQPVLDETQSAALAAKLRKQLEGARTYDRVPDVRSRALAAIALSGHNPGLPEDELKRIVEVWWPKRPSLPREHDYALFELLHALRDNLEVDFQEDARFYFAALPLEHLLGYYPAVYPAPENDYQIPCFRGAEPDLNRAALFRAAELAMVAYNSNTVEYQYLQGWLTRDRFALRSAFGSPYEFLWANPYQPGLSYRTLPALFHDASTGRVFVRSGWTDDARWLGYFDGQLQVFENGEIRPLDLSKVRKPIQVGTAIAVPGASSLRFALDLPDGGHVFVVGLKPNQRYEVEVDDQEMSEEVTGAGGVLAIEFPPGTRAGFRMRESTYAASYPAPAK